MFPKTMIQFSYNGKASRIAAGSTITDFLQDLKARPELVTVEVNNVILQKLDYENVRIHENDRVECVFYMGGGAVFDHILELIGQTPMVRLSRITETGSAEIYAKLEMFNPGASVKDRIAFNMIEQAEKKGLLKPGSSIVEPTSGNTGIGLAIVGAVKGYKVILVMPDGMSRERLQILESFGAQVVLTPSKEGMAGAVDRAREIVNSMKDAFMPQQFKNPDNPGMHRKTTAKEILRDMDGQVDAFVAGVGTGGTITGVAKVLKEHNSQVKIIAVEPKTSSVLSGGRPGPHLIQGIGAGFVPDVLDLSLIDQIVTVSDQEAYQTARKLSRQEGIFAGISCGAACFAALKTAGTLGAGKKVVVIFPDSGERYLSLEPFFKE